MELYDDNDFRNLIRKDIDEDYGKGKLGSLDVIIMKENGFVNAIKLRENADKDFNNWMQMKRHKRIVDELIRRNKRKGGNTHSILEVTTGPKKTRGTYVDSLLITHVAAWCNVNYASEVSRIVMNFHVNEADDMEKIIAEKDKEIKR